MTKVFTDGGASAKTTQREAFQAMLRFCKDPRQAVGYVVVYDLSRFSRSMEDQMVVMSELKAHGVVLRSVTENIDESPSGKFLRNMTGAFNQYENDRKSERTVVGMKKAASLGRFPFKGPLGYINVGDGSGRNLIPDPKSSRLISKAFELAATGLHAKTEILRMMTRLGLETAKGRALTPQTFQKLLLNPIYAGWVSIPSWAMKVPGAFEPLVDQEVFDRVQDVLAGRRPAVTAYQRNNPDFPLRVFVTCGACGQPLTGSWSSGRKKKYVYYKCRLSTCRSVNIKREVLETKFTNLLEWLAPDTAQIPAFKEAIRTVWKQRQGDSEALYAKAREKISMATVKKNQLVDALLGKGIDQQTYDEQVARLNADNDQVQRELREAESEYVDLEGVLAFAEKIISRPARLWLESSLDQRQRLQTIFFPSGITFEGEEFGTGSTSLFFSMMKGFAGRNDDVVSPMGFEPMLSP